MTVKFELSNRIIRLPWEKRKCVLDGAAVLPAMSLTGLVCIFACGENRGVVAVQPPTSNSPPDCCI